MDLGLPRIHHNAREFFKRTVPSSLWNDSRDGGYTPSTSDSLGYSTKKCITLGHSYATVSPLLPSVISSGGSVALRKRCVVDNFGFASDCCSEMIH